MNVLIQPLVQARLEGSAVALFGLLLFELASATGAQAAISNPEGHWQLTPPTSAEIGSLYNENGRGRTGSLPLASFSSEDGNFAGQFPPTVNIEYQASPRQVTLFIMNDTSIPLPLDKHDAGLVQEVESFTETIAGYACDRRMVLGVLLEVSSDTEATLSLLQRFEFASTGPAGNCTDYLSGIQAGLQDGTAPDPWPLFASSGGIKVNRLQDLREIHLTYEFRAVRLSPVTTLLPHCDDAPLFDAPPVDLTQLTGIVPLGNLVPPAHTFPASHLYFYLKRDNPADPYDWTYPTVSTPVHAMGSVRITEVESSEQLSVSPTHTDYTIRYAACREVGGYYHVMTALDPAFAEQVGPIDPGSCTIFTTGGATFRRCSKTVSLDVASGAVLGTAGGDFYANGLDVGLRDTRVTLPFLSPDKYSSDALHTVCAIDYMVPALKSSAEALLGSYLGDYHRTATPLCGGDMYDVAGTGSGAWFFPGASTEHDDPHLALVPDYTNPDLLSFSVGTSIASLPTGVYSYAPAADPGSLVNRRFDLVVPGQVYCYESLGFVSGGTLLPFFSGRIILLDMPDAMHLRVASMTGFSTCGAGPFVMPPDAATFVR